MKPTRRKFLSRSLKVIAAAPFIGCLSQAADSGAKPLRILILGGTGFLGPACTQSALLRGHRVTHFNSGRTEARRKERGIPSVVPPQVEQLYGNRDPDKTADERRNEGRPEGAKDPTSPKGLSQLQGRKWDAVIDTSGYFPRMVKASAGLLAPAVKQYVFISSISVYARNDLPGYDETASTLTLSDPTTEDMGKNFENFGGGKALCENAAEAAMPGRVTNIRPGYIVGPRDTSARFLYWPVRASLGGEAIIPGTPADPIQIIDVRDLADWIIHCIEQNITGTFNATGPDKELSMKAMAEAIRSGIDAKVSHTWVPLEFLESHKVSLARFPLYAPPSGETAGFHRCSIRRALSKGLKFRPVPETAKATMQWYKSLDSELQTRVAPQFATDAKPEPWLETEKRVLAAWKSGKER